MKAAGIKTLKDSLENLPQEETVELILRLARFKNENKELLTYLLFESQDEQSFINLIKQEIDDEFAGINNSSWYFVRKSLRKIIRQMNRYARYSPEKETQIQLLIYFCKKIREAGYPITDVAALRLIYTSQYDKIQKLIRELHPDLQYDYRKSLDEL